MRIFDNESRVPALIPLPKGLGLKSLNTRLLITLLPPVILLMIVTGYMTYVLSSQFISTALQRNVRVQTLAVAHEIERKLTECRRDLLFIAQSNPGPAEMRNFLIQKRVSGGTAYSFFAFISQIDGNHTCFAASGSVINQIPRDKFQSIRPNPVLVLDKVREMKNGQVWLSQVEEAEYPFPSKEGPNNILALPVVEFATPRFDDSGRLTGFYLLALDARTLRNILSLYNSTNSPLWAYARTHEIRYSFMVDTKGWILFQSDEHEDTSAPLGTYLARSGQQGTLGKPGLACAFRPSATNKNFWKIVGDIKQGKQDLIDAKNSELFSIIGKEHFIGYAPVKFAPSDSAAPSLYGGIGYVDRSRLTLVAGYKHIDVIFIIILISTIVITLLIFGISRFFTRPIFKLAKAVKEIESAEELHEISLPYNGLETRTLMKAINKMIATMKRQVEEIKKKDQEIRNVNLMGRASLDEEIMLYDDSRKKDLIPEIVGFGPEIDKLKSDIIKAAQVDVDVLIIGETGTGKQLAAEAVHTRSQRSRKPFIAINCGALDENLLLDTLFGHVKGAFTEAKTDRKGAFLEAQGGTLFLDEIQAASPRVQQSLLRAIAMRKIKPLGSDGEIDVNVRLVAATNRNLKELISRNLFREDLYFRLKVVTVRTPPLRKHRENIPFLAWHFLNKTQHTTGKSGTSFSKGALESLKNHDWPGNIRELENTITRALVMSEGKIIQAADLHLEGGEQQETAPLAAVREKPVREKPLAAEKAKPSPAKSAPVKAERISAPPARPELNERQQKAMPAIISAGETSRGKYQELVGGGLPSRTAIYDLQDMVKKGILKKTGRGPATKYLLVSGKEGS